jgi:hypothetical protein
MACICGYTTILFDCGYMYIYEATVAEQLQSNLYVYTVPLYTLYSV